MDQRLCILTYAISIIICSSSIVYYYYNVPKNTSSRYLVGYTICIILWLLCGMQEHLSTHNRELIKWAKLTLLPMNYIGWFFYCFSSFYSGYTNKYIRYITLSLITVFSIPLFIDMQFMSNLIILDKSIIEDYKTTWGFLFKISYIINYLLIIAGMSILMINIKTNYKRHYKSQLAIFISFIVPIILNLINTYLFPFKLFDPTPTYLSLSLILLIQALIWNESINLTKTFSNELFFHSDKSIIIIDSENNIINYNKQARDFFSTLFDFNTSNKLNVFFDMIKNEQNNGKISDITDYLNSKISTLYSSNIFITDKNSRNFYMNVMINPINLKDNIIGRVITFENLLSTITNYDKNEREKFSQLIHDFVLPINYEIIAKIGVLNKMLSHSDYSNILQDIESTTVQLYTTLAIIKDTFEPPQFETYGFLNCLKSRVDKFISILNIEIELLIFGIDEKLDMKLCENNFALYLMSICEQAIYNTYHHCSPVDSIKAMTISLNYDSETLNLIICDNNCSNINTTNVYIGNGIQGMRYCAKIMNGEITFSNRDGFLIKCKISLKVD